MAKKNKNSNAIKVNGGFEPVMNDIYLIAAGEMGTKRCETGACSSGVSFERVRKYCKRNLRILVGEFLRKNLLTGQNPSRAQKALLCVLVQRCLPYS